MTQPRCCILYPTTRNVAPTSGPFATKTKCPKTPFVPRVKAHQVARQHTASMRLSRAVQRALVPQERVRARSGQRIAKCRRGGKRTWVQGTPLGTCTRNRVAAVLCADVNDPTSKTCSSSSEIVVLRRVAKTLCLRIRPRIVEGNFVVAFRHGHNDFHFAVGADAVKITVRSRAYVPLGAARYFVCICFSVVSYNVAETGVHVFRCVAFKHMTHFRLFAKLLHLPISAVNHPAQWQSNVRKHKIPHIASAARRFFGYNFTGGMRNPSAIPRGACGLYPPADRRRQYPPGVPPACRPRNQAILKKDRFKDAHVARPISRPANTLLLKITHRPC